MGGWHELHNVELADEKDGGADGVFFKVDIRGFGDTLEYLTTAEYVDVEEEAFMTTFDEGLKHSCC